MDSPTGRFLLYKSADGKIEVDVLFQDESVWLTQAQIADLFGKGRSTITEHIKHIFSEGELEESSVCRKFRHTAADGKNYDVLRYNLDLTISVGYRVSSAKATQFRIWATKVLKEYIVKGFALDDERLKRGGSLGEDYFQELIERIRDIRASERRFYQKITDMYAQCSIDYDPASDITQQFYATVQNKLHWGIHGHTAAELIVERADASRPKMGLTSWKNSPEGKIRRSDVSIAKNYLNEDELRKLNRIVTMYLDYAETQAEKRQSMTMKDWVGKLDAFLQFNEKDILTNPGKVSAAVAKELAEKEFDKYEAQQRQIEATQPVSDFDKLLEHTKQLEHHAPKKGPRKKGTKRENDD